jgi:hypothetical protein
MWAWFICKIGIGESLKALKKSVAEKIGGETKLIFIIAIIKT